jgi:hypothetical protein
LSSIGSAIDFPDCWGLVKIEVVRETRTWAITTYSYSRESGKSKNLSKACTGNQIPQRKNWQKFSCFSMLSNGFHYSFSNVPQIPHNQIRKKIQPRNIICEKTTLRVICQVIKLAVCLFCRTSRSPIPACVRKMCRSYTKYINHQRNHCRIFSLMSTFK